MMFLVLKSSCLNASKKQGTFVRPFIRRLLFPSTSFLRKNRLPRAKDPLHRECRGPDSNRHVPFRTRDFKSRASTNFATPAAESTSLWSLLSLSSLRRIGAIDWTRRLDRLNRLNRLKRLVKGGDRIRTDA